MRISDWSSDVCSSDLTVVKTWGSSPRPVGSQLIVDDRLRLQGSVSGGCIEGAVVHEAQAIMAGAPPKLLEFGVSDEQAWDVGLARSEEHTSELQSLMRISYAVFCLKKKKKTITSIH